MTSKLTRQAPDDERLEVFPDFPPRDDMQNIIHLHQEGYLAALSYHFGRSDSTLVLVEVPVYWHPSRYARIPDVIIAFNINQPAVIARNGYSIDEIGKPPDFVLEIASPTTARNDYTQKRLDYAAFGIPEYWRFDPSGGNLYDAPLAGDRLLGNAYLPIDIIHTNDGNHWGHSEALNLDICWQSGRLRWWNPATQAYLETHDEVAEARLAEREARLAAEARVRELEAELARRQST